MCRQDSVPLIRTAFRNGALSNFIIHFMQTHVSLYELLFAQYYIPFYFLLISECLYIGNDINYIIEAISQGWYAKKKKVCSNVVERCNQMYFWNARTILKTITNVSA